MFTEQQFKDLVVHQAMERANLIAMLTQAQRANEVLAQQMAQQAVKPPPAPSPVDTGGTGESTEGPVAG